MTAQTARPERSLLLHQGTRTIVVVALLVGAVLGFAGNVVEPGSTQSILYGLSAVGLITASVLLAVEHGPAGHRLAAAGFALLALGEARVLNPTDAPGGEGSFAVGVLLYTPALLLIATSPWAPRWVRLVGALAAIPFAAHSVSYLSGAEVDSTGPLAGAGYLLLTITILGWVFTLLRSGTARRAAPRGAATEVAPG